MMPPNLVLSLAMQGIFESLANGAATSRCSRLFHARTFALADEFSQTLDSIWPGSRFGISIYILSNSVEWAALILVDPVPPS